MVVRVVSYEPEEHVIPHAIIWRPLRYFTIEFRKGEDDLDTYEGASFVIGNGIRFDLRSYREHPGLTVTLYLPEKIVDENQISEMLDRIFQEMFVPPSAVAWRRGEEFVSGTLKRRPDDRLHEKESRILVLKIAAQEPDHAASTSFLKNQVPRYTELSARDRQRSQSRPREETWQQIVGNVISHNQTAAGPFVQGYALKTGNGILVMEKGLRYLNSMGFSNFPLNSDSE